MISGDIEIYLNHISKFKRPGAEPPGLGVGRHHASQYLLSLRLAHLCAQKHTTDILKNTGAHVGSKLMTPKQQLEPQKLLGYCISG